MKVALYPGSFDPITNGHMDVLKRAVSIFDKVIVLVAINPDKKGRFSIEDRVEMIKEAVSEFPNVEVDSYKGLTVRYAKDHGATHLIRGLRAVTDFEYEYQLASANALADNSIDMVFFMSRGETSNLTSSTIMELAKNGVDVSHLVPPSVLKRIK
ncbi:MAG: pantetheine-phosphate adenylyltransferase [Erysipelotrichaceae bacterium]|nr:pantetheine-phosphate adenylyltransferase [Erysipelotrichaceae bacterium]